LNAPITSRPIRTFVLRQGHFSEAQERACDELLPRFGIDATRTPLDVAAAFGRPAPTIVEIGFGMGDSLAQTAAEHPEWNFIGIEVHLPGVGSLLKQVDARGLANVRVIRHDAVEVLEWMIAADSLDAIHLFFPDPWPKKRHHKRRIVQPELVRLMASRLRPGGMLHMATDWEDYALHMLEVVSAEPLLDNPSAGFAQRPETRPLTRFEQRGLRLGHGVWDLVLRRREQSPAGTGTGTAGR
jgi:tRNA (guanine-N7-)-methyltransferase